MSIMSTAPSDLERARAEGARRVAAMKARLRRIRNRALAAGGASFVLALAAVLYQQHEDADRTAQAASGQVEAGTDEPSWVDQATQVLTDDDHESDEQVSDDDSSGSSLSAPTTSVS